MKKLTLIAACLMMVSAVSAQGVWSFGVKGGMNITTLTNTKDFEGPSLNRKPKTGVYVGGLAEFKINDIVGLQGEVVYSRQGVTFYDKDGDASARLSIKMDYINVPVLVKFYPVNRLSIDFGPQFGFVVSGRYMVKMSEKNPSMGDSDMDAKKAVGKQTIYMKSSMYNVFDFSLALGVNYEVFDMVDVSVRYNYGFTEVLKGNPTNDKVKNSVFQIGASYKF